MPTLTRDTSFSKRITIPNVGTGFIRLLGCYYDGFLYYWIATRVGDTVQHVLQRIDLTSANRPNFSQNNVVTLTRHKFGAPSIIYDIADGKLYVIRQDTRSVRPVYIDSYDLTDQGISNKVSTLLYEVSLDGGTLYIFSFTINKNVAYIIRRNRFGSYLVDAFSLDSNTIIREHITDFSDFLVFTSFRFIYLSFNPDNYHDHLILQNQQSQNSWDVYSINSDNTISRASEFDVDYPTIPDNTQPVLSGPFVDEKNNVFYVAHQRSAGVWDVYKFDAAYAFPLTTPTVTIDDFDVSKFYSEDKISTKLTLGEDGVYDDIQYKVSSSVENGSFDDPPGTDTDNFIYTFDARTDTTFSWVLDFIGTGNIADTGAKRVTVTKDFSIADLPVAPTASLPTTVTITSNQTEETRVGETLTFTVETSEDGINDNLTYKWIKPAWGSFLTDSTQNVVQVLLEQVGTNLQLTCELTSTGDGIRAKDDTSTTQSYQSSAFNVLLGKLKLPDGIIFSGLNTGVLNIDSIVTALPQGGVYDAITYSWKINPSSAGEFKDNSETTETITLNPLEPTSVVKYFLTITVKGDGVNVEDSDTILTEPFESQSFSIVRKSSIATDLRKLNDIRPGSWKETPQPGVFIQIDPNTMLLMAESSNTRKVQNTSGEYVDVEGRWKVYPLINEPVFNLADSNTLPFNDVENIKREGTFWYNRLVGNRQTSPAPSFLPKRDIKKDENGLEKEELPPITDEHKFYSIEDIAFFQNRLVLLTQDSIIFSFAGVPTLFWTSSQKQIIPADPIDLFIGNNTPARALYIRGDSIFIMCDAEQYRVYSTTQDSWQPGTIKIDHAGHSVADISIGVKSFNNVVLALSPDNLPLGATLTDQAQLADIGMTSRAPNIKVNQNDIIDLTPIKALNKVVATDGKLLYIGSPYNQSFSWTTCGFGNSPNTDEPECTNETEINILAIEEAGEDLLLLVEMNGSVFLERLYLGEQIISRYNNDNMRPNNETSLPSHVCLDHFHPESFNVKTEIQDSMGEADLVCVDMDTGSPKTKEINDNIWCGYRYCSDLTFGEQFIRTEDADGISSVNPTHFSIVNWIIKCINTSFICACVYDYDYLKTKNPYSTNQFGYVAPKRRRSIEKGSLQSREQSWKIPISVSSERLTVLLTSSNHLGYSIQGCEFEANTSVKGREISSGA